jgi:hypothetical protein
MDADWPSLTAALVELRGVASVAHRPLAIALLPSLVQVRRLELPKLQGDKLRLFLGRNAARYFPMVRETHSANGVLLDNGSPAPYLAASVATRVIDAIVRAVYDASWTLATITPAEGAWTAAARRRWPALQRQAGDVAVPLDDYVEILRLERGRLVATRRFRTGDAPADALLYTIDSPEETAAAYVHEAQTPEILPEAEYARRAHGRRSTWVRAAVAAVVAILCIAGGVLWNAHRELNDIKAQREALRVSVGEVVEGQGDIGALTTPLNALARIETTAPVWSEVFADVAGNLPTDAYLLSFHARDDSLSAEGLAARGATVFERMADAALIDSVRAAGPIRREAQRGAGPIDHFTLVARVMGAVPLYATKGTRR